MSEPRLTKRQAAIVGAYTGILCGNFADMQEFVEEILGRPTWTHEFAFKADEIKAAAKPYFLEICNNDES